MGNKERTNIYIDKELKARAKMEDINLSEIAEWALRKILGSSKNMKKINMRIQELQEQKKEIQNELYKIKTEIEALRKKRKEIREQKRKEKERKRILREHREKLKEMKQAIEKTGNKRAVWRRFKGETGENISFDVFMDQVQEVG